MYPKSPKGSEVRKCIFALDRPKKVVKSIILGSEIKCLDVKNTLFRYSCSTKCLWVKKKWPENAFPPVKVICFSPLAYVYCVLICLWASQGIEKQPRHILHRGNPTVRWVFLVQGIMLWTRLTGGSCSGAVARVENPGLDEGPSSIRYTLR